MTPFNLAIFYELKYISDHRVFYCPEQQSTWHMSDSWPEPWGSSTGTQNSIRAAYDYNPFRPVKTKGHTYRRISDARPDTTLALDVLAYDIEDAFDALAHDWAPGWNLGRFDGSVQFYISQAAREYKQTMPKGPADVGRSITAYETALGYIQYPQQP
jgi:hypothetical protein